MQEVAVNQVVTELWEMRLQVLHRLPIEFYHSELRELALEQILGKHAHARPDFQHVRVGCEHRLCDVLRNRLIIQKMLS